MILVINLFGLNSPLPWGEGWLKASDLKSAVNTPLLAAGCFIRLCYGGFRSKSIAERNRTAIQAVSQLFTSGENWSQKCFNTGPSFSYTVLQASGNLCIAAIERSARQWLQ